MSEERAEYDSKTRLAFSIGEVGDGVAYQTFSFLIFSFYFTVVKLPISLISAGFIIWSVWNSINDPLLGHFSDKTKNKNGRRTIWMKVATIPLAIMMILLFTAPIQAETTFKFTYFLIMLFLFDLFYSMFNLNYNSLWSEMFITVKDRSEVGRLRGIFVILSLVFAYLLPTLIIEDMTNQYNYPYTAGQYILTGIIAAIIILIAYFIVLKRGAKERTEFRQDAETSPSFKDSIRYSFKNKAFTTFVVAALATWICNGILPTMVPLFATYVLGIADENSILIGVLLLFGFLTGGLTMPLWTWIRQKKGARYTGMVVFIVWMISLLIFMNTTNFISAIIVMIFVGFGLGGSIYFYDQCIAEVIDEDEVKYSTRRAGDYYGIINFVIRFAGVLNFLIIGVVFTGSDWESYTPNPGIDVITGLKVLMGVYPAVVLVIGLIALYFYPIKGKRLEEDRRLLNELHEKKRNSIENK